MRKVLKMNADMDLVTSAQLGEGEQAESGEKIDLQKLLGRPEAFAGDDAKWQSWAFTMRSYLAALGLVTQAQLDAVEAWGKPIPIGALPIPFRRKSSILFYLLVACLRGSALVVVQKCEASNGFEAWRLLTRRYQRTDGGSSLGRLRAVIDFTFRGGAEYLDDLASWEVLVQRYNMANPLEEISESVLKMVLIRGSPEPLKSHLELTGAGMSFHELRNAVETFVRNRRDWDTRETGSLAAPGRVAEPIPAPMDVDQIAAMKGKGKQGKGKWKGKGRPAGKAGGKTGAQGRGRGLVASPKPYCHCCGEEGHRTSECMWAEQIQETEDLTGIQCWLCGGWGHRARHCATRHSEYDECALIQGDLPPGLSKDSASVTQPGHDGSKQDNYWTMGLFQGGSEEEPCSSFHGSSEEEQCSSGVDTVAGDSGDVPVCFLQCPAPDDDDEVQVLNQNRMKLQ